MEKPLINTIIFDLGNVIINIDLMLSFEAFQSLAPQYSLYDMKALAFAGEAFVKHEKGFIDDEAFFMYLQQQLGETLSLQAIEEAWNALLLDIPTERLRCLEALSEHYRLFLLSNTNAAHIEGVEKELQRVSNYKKLDELFEKVYYSHQMGKHKPEAAIYQQILTEQRLSAEQCFFVDDNLANVQAAEALGIRSRQVLVGQNSMLDFFDSNYRIII